MADINNVTFVMPTTALLQAHYFNASGVFTTNFLGNPLITFNYNGEILFTVLHAFLRLGGIEHHPHTGLSSGLREAGLRCQSRELN